MDNYAVYYSYKKRGDVLQIVFNAETYATQQIITGRVFTTYHNDEIMGYDIMNIKDIIKIKSDGLIYLPSNELIDVINTLLKNENLPTLEYKKNSGFLIAEVKNVSDVIELDLGDETVTALKNKSDLKVGDKVVIAKVGTRLNDGKKVCTSSVNGREITAHICTNRELSIEDNNDTFVIDEDVKNGQDFFMMEEK